MEGEGGYEERDKMEPMEEPRLLNAAASSDCDTRSNSSFFTCEGNDEMESTEGSSNPDSAMNAATSGEGSARSASSIHEDEESHEMDFRSPIQGQLVGKWTTFFCTWNKRKIGAFVCLPVAVAGILVVVLMMTRSSTNAPSSPDQLCLQQQIAPIPDKKELQKLIAQVLDGDFSFEEIHGRIECWDTSKVTDMEGLFNSVENFAFDISRWDVSNVDSMAFMFRSTTGCNFGDLSKWNISSVTNLGYTFANSDGNFSISDWDTSNVVVMSATFQGATNFNRPLNWDTSNVHNMTRLFENAASFDQDLSKWKTSSVRLMNFMFKGATAFNNGEAQQPTCSALYQKGIVGDMDEASCDATRDAAAPCMCEEASNASSIVVPKLTNGSYPPCYLCEGGEGFVTVTPDASFHITGDTFGDYSCLYAVSLGLSGHIEAKTCASVRNDSFIEQCKCEIREIVHASTDPKDPEHVSLGAITAPVPGEFPICNICGSGKIPTQPDALISAGPTIDSWDVSNVETMEGMFLGATSFNQSLCSWGDRVNAMAVDVSGMFSGTQCADTSDPLKGGSWCHPCN